MPTEVHEFPSLLSSFFVFNYEKSFPENEEHKSVIYFFPENASLDTQMKETGKAAAIVKFARTFDTNNPCKSLHTTKCRQYFYLPEPGYCMVLTLKVQRDDEKASLNPTEINDSVFHSILKYSYKMFRLFMGNFTDGCKDLDYDEERKSIMNRASYFFSKYLSSVPFETAELSDALFGVQFLPLDKLLFLKVQGMVHAVEQAFPCIQHSLIFYQDQVIWGGLCQEDMQLVNHYLLTGLLPASATKSQDSRFLTGPNSGRSLTDMKTPRLFLNHGNAEPDECHLVVYRVSNLVLCLFIQVSTTLSREFFVNVDAVLAPKVALIATEIAEQTMLHKSQLSSSNGGDLRFIYFNQANLAFKSTLHQTSPTHGRVLQCNSTSAEALKVCADLSEDLKIWGDGEILVKTMNDSWVVSKLNNRRELYVVVTRKSANLTEIYDEVRRVCSTTLNNILMLD